MHTNAIMYMKWGGGGTDGEKGRDPLRATAGSTSEGAVIRRSTPHLCSDEE